jgi:hypothetical protein
MPTSTARSVRSFFAVDEEFGEGARLRVPPELSDPVGSLEGGKQEDVEQFGAGIRPVEHAGPARVGGGRGHRGACGERALDAGLDPLPIAALLNLIVGLALIRHRRRVTAGA